MRDYGIRILCDKNREELAVFRNSINLHIQTTSITSYNVAISKVLFLVFCIKSVVRSSTRQYALMFLPVGFLLRDEDLS